MANTKTSPARELRGVRWVKTQVEKVLAVVNAERLGATTMANYGE